MTHFFSRLKRFFAASDDSGQSTAGLARPGGPHFSHPLTAPGVGAVGLAHILHPEPLAQVSYFLRVAGAGQQRCLSNFHLGPFPLSVLSIEISCILEASCILTNCPSQVSEPVPLVLMLAQEYAHTQLFLRLCVCVSVCLYSSLFSSSFFLLPLRLCENFSSIWQGA